MSEQEFNKIKYELKQTKDVYSTLSEVRNLIIYIVSASYDVKKYLYLCFVGMCIPS